MKAIVTIIVCLFSAINLAEAHTFSIQLKQIVVPAGVEDIGFSQEYGIDSLLKKVGASFLTGDENIEMNLEVGFCENKNNPAFMPDWSSRCKTVARLNSDDIVIFPNHTKTAKVMMPANSIYEVELDAKGDVLAFNYSGRLSTQESIYKLKIYAYDWGFDEELISISPSTSCFAEVIRNPLQKCVVRTTGLIQLEFLISYVQP